MTLWISPHDVFQASLFASCTCANIIGQRKGYFFSAFYAVMTACCLKRASLSEVKQGQLLPSSLFQIMKWFSNRKSAKDCKDRKRPNPEEAKSSQRDNGEVSRQLF